MPTEDDRPIASFNNPNRDRPTASCARSASFAESSSDLPVELALELEKICTAFEATWRTGTAPSLWDAVASLSGPLRSAALRELIALDVYYRQQKGESPTNEDYATQVPDVERRWLERIVSGADPNARTATSAWKTTADATFATGEELFGAYKILGEVARGAMGIVFRARQVSLDRVVALKVVRSGEFADPDEVRRFRAEAEAAGTLDHPNIVSIFEVGEHRGVQYYAMRLVEGGSLAARMSNWTLPKATNRTEARQRQLAIAGLMSAVTRAVHHAHQRSILHRDLKPGNILLDESGTPHVTDFGLARRIGRDSTLTRTGAILGTPSYMAPEQARGREDVTTEADVYGLGAVLYHLLADRPPFAGEDVLDTLYQVREREPASVRSHCPLVDRDLETICLKCLEKDPNKRYSSAAALADDLDRWRNREPILARRASTFERVVKWCRRHPAGAGMVALGAVAAAAVIWGLVALSYNAELAEGKRKVEAANGQLQIEKDEADRLRGIAVEQRGFAEDQRKIADVQRKRATEQESLARRFLYVTQMNQAQRAYEEKKFGHALALLEKVRPERPEQEDLRGPEWHHLWRLCGGSHIEMRGHNAAITCAIYSTDGWMLASGDSSGVVKLWDLETQRERRTLTGPTAVVNAVAFDAKGKSVAAACDDRIVYVWDVETGREVSRFTGHGDAVLCLAFHPTADRIVSGARDGSVNLWEASKGERVHDVLKDGKAVQAVAVTSEGKIVAAIEDGAVRSWNAETGVAGIAWPPLKTAGGVEWSKKRVTCVALSPNGRFALVGGYNSPNTGQLAQGSLQVRTFPENEKRHEWPFEAEAVVNVCVSAAGNSLVTSSSVANIRVYELGEGTRIKSFQKGTINGVCIEPTGKTVVTFGEDRIIRLRILKDEVALGGGSSVAFSRDSQLIVTRYGPIQDVRSGRMAGSGIAVWNPGHGRVSMSPDGRYVSDGGTIHDQKTHADSILPFPPHRISSGIDAKLGVAFCPDGRSLAVAGSYSKGPLIFDLDPPRLRVFLNKETPISGTWTSCVRYSPDGKTLAVGFGHDNYAEKSGEIQLWDVESRKLRLVLDRHYFSVWDLAFSPDGKYIAAASGIYKSGSRAGEVRIWDATSGRNVATLGGYSACVWNLSYSPDGTRLATASGHYSDPTIPALVRIWDLVAGQELISFQSDGAALGIAYSPDGKRLAVVGNRPTTGRIWGPP
jgi:WD40 repeat protein